jgi:hypothetical protein
MDPIDNPLEAPAIKQETSSAEDFEYLEKSDKEIKTPENPKSTQNKNKIKNQKKPNQPTKPENEALDDPLTNKTNPTITKNEEDLEKSADKVFVKVEDMHSEEDSEIEEEKIEEIKKKEEAKEVRENVEKDVLIASVNSVVDLKEKSKNKHLNKRDKLKEILVNIYKHSVYYEFIKVAQVLSYNYLKYISPLESRKLIKSFIIMTDFAIVVLIKKEFFIKKTNWFDFPEDLLENENEEEEKEDEEKEHEDPNHPKLPFRREYFFIPYTMIDDIDHDPNEQILAITTKVVTLMNLTFFFYVLNLFVLRK